MLKNIVLIGHGSRYEKGNVEFISLVNLVSQLPGVGEVGYGFLEYAKPDIPTGIVSLIEKGSRHVYAVPILLFAAGHEKNDFPQHVDIARELSSKISKNVEIVLTRHLDVDERIISIVRNRALEVSDGGIKSDEAVLLVGRGSKYNSANEDSKVIISKLKKQFKDKDGCEDANVKFSFLDLAKPNIPEGIEGCIKEGIKVINIIPYFLFDGILIQRISEQIEAYRKQYDVEIRFGRYMGVDKLLAEVIVDRAVDGSNKK